MKSVLAALATAALLAAAPTALFAQTGEPGKSGPEIDPNQVQFPEKCRALTSPDITDPLNYNNLTDAEKMQRAKSTSLSKPIVTTTNLADRPEVVSRSDEGLLIDPPSGYTATPTPSKPGPDVYCFPSAFRQ
ncbi:hypothetical protein [Gloeobacter kilaueensis]|uniref:Uncharacterized protein n=1 Tax=Gloeobacter kilaueensis (strain ATCC BAA-2537 / CCAP 1431/1 / ULC 316 / JS1) TaxID=1183438 RepID=U5QJY1_GLOK1|nr:hypothetical protein [Gloeobacter kilaueensis]AGY59198.1 hypothetical protein GKIL_2952 [Gloeobacter kilaueensis JS1]